jgi:hypothetical protein
MKKLKLLITFVFIIAAFASCDKRKTENRSEPIPSGYGIFPVTMQSKQGGNLNCEDLIGEYPGGTTGRINYDKGTNTFDADFSDYGLNVTVNKGTYVSFDMDPASGWCVGAVIVKGGNASNVFYYDPGVKSDQGLSAPINPSGKPAGLSNLTFCFVKCEEPLVIAVKTWYWDESGSYRWGASTGNKVFTYSWCGYGYLGINDYPGISPIALECSYTDSQIGEVTVSEDGTVTVTLNEGLTIDKTYLYIGTLADLLNFNIASDRCPDYTNQITGPWLLNDEDGNSQTFSF